MYLLNGESKHNIEFSDRGFQYGDGLFETIEILNASPIFLKLHLARLLDGCKRLRIPLPDLALLEKEALQLSNTAVDSSHAVLKIIMTRGSGGRGYRQPESIVPSRLLSIHPFPDYPVDYSEQGIQTKICSTSLGLNPVLAGIKHMNRLEQVLARAEWDSEFQEGLMLDIQGHVIEGTMSNIFVVKNDSLYTPLLDQCGVTGIIRNILITLAKNNNIPVFEQRLSRENIYSADEVFVTNSIIGIWPVKRLEKQSFKIGSITKKIAHIFTTFKDQQGNVC